MPKKRLYEKLVTDAKKRVSEISAADAAEIVKESDNVVLIDVREREEWNEEHIPEAIHLSRGTIESEIEGKVPDDTTMIICHCGGGGRSALVAGSLQKMGYENVWSLAGGLKAWKELGLPTKKVISEQ
jgi:rhodanese-related sulfurtransferase